MIILLCFSKGVIQWTRTMSEIQLCLQGIGQILLGTAQQNLQEKILWQDLRRNRTGKCAAGAVSIWTADAFTMQPDAMSVCIKKVICIAMRWPLSEGQKCESFHKVCEQLLP